MQGHDIGYTTILRRFSHGLQGGLIGFRVRPSRDGAYSIILACMLARESSGSLGTRSYVLNLPSGDSCKP